MQLFHFLLIRQFLKGEKLTFSAIFTISSKWILSSCSSCRLRSCLSCSFLQDKQDRKRHDEQDDKVFGDEIVKVATFSSLKMSR